METGNRDKRPVRVTIANQAFTLLTAGDDREVLDLAHQVDDLITGIAARSTSADTSRLAILACLHLIDRLHSAEQELKTIRDRIEQRSRSLEGLLDSVLDSVID